MYTATISSKFRVVIPSEVRKQFGLKPGQRIAFVPYNKTLRLIVVPSMEETRGILKDMDNNGYREDEDENRS
jgi:AbrB family looped-hinge helix DNA binding protein